MDCGSTAFETVRRLRERGVDVIVLITTRFPRRRRMRWRWSIRNCKVESQSRESRAGKWRVLDLTLTFDTFLRTLLAGLAFKLAHALVKRGRETDCRARRNLICGRCSIWSRWARLPTSCR